MIYLVVLIRCWLTARTTKEEMRGRLVTKAGKSTAINQHMRRHRGHCFNDMFTSLVEARWRWTLVFFFGSFYFSWIVFTAAYWVIIYNHGDLGKSITSLGNY